jgi:twinkle protein
VPEFLNDDIDFAAYLKDTDAKTKVKPAREFVQDAKDRLRSRAKAKRTYLPWPKCNESFEFRMGEVTMMAGQNGGGKTDVSTQMALSLIGQNEKVCVASFEMKPVTTISRMVRMFSMTNPFSPEYQGEDGLSVMDTLYDDFGAWTTDRLWLYDQTGTARPDTVLGMVKYCANELGIKYIFIDSLMKCIRDEDDYNGQKAFVDQLCALAKRPDTVLGMVKYCANELGIKYIFIDSLMKCIRDEDDYNGQKAFVDQLCALAKDCDCQIIIIHHVKKPSKEGDFPDKHDTKGSGSLTDQVDNLFMVWRNKPKEEARRTQGDKSNKQTEPDCYLFCRKQRNYEGSGDGEPTIRGVSGFLCARRLNVS